ncbi:MAG: chemotaxis protein CheA [Geobacteraceae bacterium]
MDISQYRDLFISESQEYLGTVNELLVGLEKNSGDRETIDALFRVAHSIKGMAASMGYADITELAHKMEDLMDRVRKGALVFNAGIADLLLEGSDLIDAMVNDLAKDGSGCSDIASLVERLVTYSPDGDSDTPLQTVATPRGTLSEAAPVLAAEVRSPPLKGSEPRQTVRVKTQVLDRLMNITGELITNKHGLMTVAREVASERLDDTVNDLSNLLRELHDEVMQVRMMTFAAIADRFPRVVRELAKQSGKEVAFEIVGKEIELDRGILEELSDPLVHIMRNAVDHGVELPAERRTAGKPPKGSIRLVVSREQDMVVVTVEDDGRGMDPARLIAVALEKGLITREEGSRLSPREAFMLTCIPGFSTAGEITDVSGRGVGMDAVRTKIQGLGGVVSIESEAMKGSRITLKLPLTIAIINVLLAMCGGLVVAVPVTNILRTLEISHNLIFSQDRRKVFYLDNEPVPLFNLNHLFGVPSAPFSSDVIHLFLSEIKGRMVGLTVDRFLGQREVFIKPLGRPLTGLRGISGAAMLGAGEIVFILDIANLI